MARIIEEYKRDVFDKLDDDKKLIMMYEMSKQLCEIVEYAKQRCDGYLKDDCICEYCDGVYANCKKVLQIAGEDITKYE